MTTEPMHGRILGATRPAANAILRIGPNRLVYPLSSRAAQTARDLTSGTARYEKEKRATDHLRGKFIWRLGYSFCRVREVPHRLPRSG